MGDELVLFFPYDATEVAQIKMIVGAKWDRLAKVWKVPVAQLVDVRAFAERFGFSVDPDVSTLWLPSHPIGHSRVEEMAKGGFYLFFPYDPVRVRAVRDIPGATWDAKKKAWRAPQSSIVEVIAFAKAFRLDVPQALLDQQASIVARQQHLLTLSGAHDADLVLPSFKGSLYPFQRAGVSYAIKTRRLFIADEMGLGKTWEALAALEWSAQHDMPAYPALIVCPPKLTLNWRYEIEHVLPHRTTKIIKDRKLFPEDDTDFTIIGWSNVHHWQTHLKGYASLIYDESHAIKRYEAQRTRAAIKIAKAANPNGMLMLLTGTPVTNRPAEYASQIEALGRISEFGGRWGLYKRYANAFQDRWGRWHIEGHSNLDELNARLRASCYVRRTKADVMPQLEPIRHAKVMVEPDPVVMKEYYAAEADIASYMASRAEALAVDLGTSPWSAAVRARMKAESAQFLVRIAALRRLAALAKLDAVHEWVDGVIEEGEKVVVAAHHRDVVDRIAAWYGGLKIQGGMTAAEVEAAKKTFQEGSLEDAPVIVLSIQAAKAGHTLTAAQNVLLVELPWTPADVDQVIARLHRIGQEGSVLATYMLAEDTIDEDIYEMIATKRDVVNAATEGNAASRDKLGEMLMKLARKGIR